MARYRGPKNKKARTFGEAIFGDNKSLTRRLTVPPGQHGGAKKRKQRSDYAVQLQEKQKAKYTYGVLERQFSNLFKKAHAKAGVTGEILLQLLETRLDNVVYRLGLANSRSGARQMVLHRHIVLNGVVTNIASATLRAGDVVAVRGKSLNLDMITTSMAATRTSTAPWLQWNSTKMEGIVLAMPSRDQIPENINEQLIVELYSK